MPKVLILLPVLDEESNLERLLKSIISQKHEDWVLVYQDNISKDKSLKILSDFSKIDHRIVGKSLESRVSAGDNWSSLATWALDSYETEYVCWVGGDDAWSHDSYLNNIIEEARKQKNLSIIAPVFQSTDSVGNFIGNPIELKVKGLIRVRKLLKDWHYVNIILGLYPRQIFKKIFYAPSAQLTDTIYFDWWWTYTAMRISDISFSQDSTYFKALPETNQQELNSQSLRPKQKIKNLLLQPFKLVNDLFVKQRFRFNIFINYNLFLIISYYFLFYLMKSISELIYNIFLKLKIKF